MKTEWTQTPPGLLSEAQGRLRYTNEEVGRRIGRSGRAWARWRADDKVPTAMLPALAHAFKLPELLSLFDAQVSAAAIPMAQDEQVRQRAAELASELERAVAALMRALEVARGLEGWSDTGAGLDRHKRAELQGRLDFDFSDNRDVSP